MPHGSTTITTLRATAIPVCPRDRQISGRRDQRTLSLANAIFAKPVRKTSRSMANAEITKRPVAMKATVTNPDFRMVRLHAGLSVATAAPVLG
jgi:hypothetical protein